MSFMNKVASRYCIVAGDLLKMSDFESRRKETSAPHGKADVVKFPSSEPIKTKKVIKPSSPSNDKAMEKELTDLLYTEHVDGCGGENSECDIDQAAEDGFTKWAIMLFGHSGAASPRFKELFDQLSPAFVREAESERKKLVQERHRQEDSLPQDEKKKLDELDMKLLKAPMSGKKAAGQERQKFLSKVKKGNS